jgi:hypothetical protein
MGKRSLVEKIQKYLKRNICYLHRKNRKPNGYDCHLSDKFCHIFVYSEENVSLGLAFEKAGALYTILLQV